MVIAGAPRLADHLDDESAEHFSALQGLLDTAGLAYVVNPRLVRGLDYYQKMVFEWTTDRLGAQATVCAGGRYDGLVEQLGGKSTPAAGFAMGLERLLALMEDAGAAPAAYQPHAYLVLAGEQVVPAGLVFAERLRDQLPGLRLLSHGDGSGIKGQLKRADRSGAQVALIIGDDELASGQVGVKYLRRQQEQGTVAQDDVAGVLSKIMMSEECCE